MSSEMLPRRKVGLLSRKVGLHTKMLSQKRSLKDSERVQIAASKQSNQIKIKSTSSLFQNIKLVGLKINRDKKYTKQYRHRLIDQIVENHAAILEVKRNSNLMNASFNHPLIT